MDVPLSVWLAVCDGSTSNICEISLLIIVVITRMRKMALSIPHTFAFSCLWPLMSLADHV